jgi:hypothetical protein
VVQWFHERKTERARDLKRIQNQLPDIIAMKCRDRKCEGVILRGLRIIKVELDPTWILKNRLETYERKLKVGIPALVVALKAGSRVGPSG